MSTTTTATATPTFIRVPCEEDPDQIIEIVGHDFGFSRRTFVTALGAGLLIAVSTPAAFGQEQDQPVRGEQRRRVPGGSPRQSPRVPVDARLHIGKDGAITVFAGKVECGQGARAELSQAAAEELRVPIDRVTMLLADTATTPDDGITAGSRTPPSTVPAVRAAGATARQLLIAFAASQLKVPADQITVKEGRAFSNEDHVVTYADFASADPQSLKQLPSDAAVTTVDRWQTLGKSAGRPNGRDIVTGKHAYPSDLLRPGMLYGKILRPPAYGAKLVSIDLDAAKSLDGVIVTRDGDFVGVAAPSTHLAKQAIKLLAESAKWNAAPQPSSKTLSTHLRENAKGGMPRSPFGDAAGKTLRATYTIPYVQHAPMEPRAAVAEWQDGKLTVWTGTQNPFGVRRELAGAFHIDPNDVRVIVPDFGGGFGGKHTGECAIEAARLAQAAKKPVALRWTRPEEFTWAYFRPAAVIDIEASLAGDGSIATWHFVNVNAGRPGIETPYTIGKANHQSVDSAPPLRHGSYRALASTGNNFARESFMDELAAAANKDPLAFRLAHLEPGRLRDVLEAAAKAFGWGGRKTGSGDVGYGLACASEKGSFVAACAEVEIDRKKHAFRVRRLTQAFECGKILNPKNLHSQVMGAMIQGLGPVMHEAMAFEDGKITNGSFYQYEVPRQADVPGLDIHLLDRSDLPSAGAGETPLVCVAPAIANAIFDATQQRLRDLPLKLSPPEKKS
jgi:isoquinoline 1-oxidoreductase